MDIQGAQTLLLVAFSCFVVHVTADYYPYMAASQGALPLYRDSAAGQGQRRQQQQTWPYQQNRRYQGQNLQQRHSAGANSRTPLNHGNVGSRYRAPAPALSRASSSAQSAGDQSYKPSSAPDSSTATAQGRYCYFNIRRQIPCRVGQMKRVTQKYTYYCTGAFGRICTGFRVVYKPVYRTEMRMVLTSVKRCCPGFTGPDCEKECFNCTSFSHLESRLTELEQTVKSIGEAERGQAPPKGPRGSGNPHGTQLIQGPKGSRGPRGPQGPLGPPGPQGHPGPQGLPGAPGTDGPRGTSGKGGAAGHPGQPGPTGPRGPRGYPGLPGKSITGPQGLPGVRGSPGNASTIPGPQGPKGASGPTGPVGVQGPPGRDGIDGQSGFPGTPGRPGRRGLIGPAGPPGRPADEGGKIQVQIKDLYARLRDLEDRMNRCNCRQTQSLEGNVEQTMEPPTTKDLFAPPAY